MRRQPRLVPLPILGRRPEHLPGGDAPLLEFLKSLRLGGSGGGGLARELVGRDRELLVPRAAERLGVDELDFGAAIWGKRGVVRKEG